MGRQRSQRSITTLKTYYPAQQGFESDDNDDDDEYKHGSDEEGSPKKVVKRARGKVQNGTAKRGDERSA